jgi:tripartite-type tricarboxylate transporter receptor subunit TctC
LHGSGPGAYRELQLVMVLIRTFGKAAALALVGLAFAAAALGQERPVRILVGFAPGGTSDLIARLIVEPVQASLGMPVIVENRAGANGFIAAEALKNASPDGRTLMIAPIAVPVFAPLTHANLRFDPVKDFTPVSLAAHFQFALAVGPASPAKTLPEHIAWLRTNRSKAAYGVPLAGGPGHFLGVMVAQATGVDLAFVPYKGSAPLVSDLIGGQVVAGIAPVNDLAKHHQSGKLHMLASFGSHRSPVAPDVPTFKELGFAKMDAPGWQAFYTTAGTPRSMVDRLSGAIASAIKSPQISERLLALGLEPVGSTADELERRMAEDAAKWAPAIRASGFRAEEPGR